MMDFISIPVTVAVVFYGTYKLFELFVKRRERLLLIEKLADNPLLNIEEKQTISLDVESRNLFGGLKIACLFVGVGLGLLVGIFIHICWNTEIIVLKGSYIQEIAGIIYGASVFIFGGLGMLLAFFLEMKYAKQKAFLSGK